MGSFDIKSAYLLGIHPTYGSKPLAFRVPIDEKDEIYISRILPDGAHIGWTRLVRVQIALDNFPAGPISAFYAFAPGHGTQLGKYTYSISVAVLPAETAVQLSKLNTHFSKVMNSIYASVYVENAAVRQNHDHAYPNLLTIEPRSVVTRENLPKSAADLLGLVGIDSSAVHPGVILGAIFAPSVYAARNHRALAALSLRPFDGGPELYVPAVVWDACEYQAICWISEHLNHRLSTIPFVGVSARDYLDRHKTNGRLKVSNTYPIFLEQRESASSTILAVGDDLRALRRAAQPNVFARIDQSEVFHVRLADRSRGSVLHVVTNELADEMAVVSDNIRDAQEREAFLSDYLRDAASDQSARANMKVQHMVVVLTIATILLGLLSLLTSVMPEHIKDQRWEGIFGSRVAHPVGKSAPPPKGGN